jgi:hypothetical protein
MHYNIRVLILLIPSYELYFGSVELEIPNYCKDVKKKLVVVQKITKTQRERERERERKLNSNLVTQLLKCIYYWEWDGKLSHEFDFQNVIN